MTIKISLLPPDKPRWFVLDSVTLLMLLSLLAGNVGMVAWGRVLQTRVESTRQAVVEVDRENKHMEDQLPVLQQRQERIASLERQIQAIRSLASDPIRYAHLLAQVALVLPEPVWLESLSIDPSKQTLTLSGTVAGLGGQLPLNTLSRLVNDLRQSGYFEDTELTTATRKNLKTGLSAFSFQVQARYNPEVAAQQSPRAPHKEE